MRKKDKNVVIELNLFEMNHLLHVIDNDPVDHHSSREYDGMYIN
jgi:hypothetical protein